MTISTKAPSVSSVDQTMHLIYPPLNLGDMASMVASMVSAQLNEMRANPENPDSIESTMREESLDIFSSGDINAIEKMLRRDGALQRLQPGQCFTAEAAGAPVSPDRAKNVPVAFASGNFIIDREMRALGLTGVSGFQNQFVGFSDVVEISHRGMLDDMTKRGVNISARIEVLPPSACPRLP